MARAAADLVGLAVPQIQDRARAKQTPQHELMRVTQKLGTKVFDGVPHDPHRCTANGWDGDEVRALRGGPVAGNCGIRKAIPLAR